MDSDYVVVGAGSAGCILAAGLSEGGGNSVILLEAGPTDRHPYVKIPLGYGLLFYDKVRNYQYSSVAEPTLNGRCIYIPRGKTVGGSGSINALVYCRGMPSDYESWKSAGLSNWGWEDVRPFFEANERRSASEFGISVTDPMSERHPFTEVFSEAARELCIPKTKDFNGSDPEGVGYYHITTKSGLRNTSADVFLRPALRKRHVRLLIGAIVQKVNIISGVATDVTFTHQGQLKKATARRGVVLTAGAINSPQLLQLSGIGDPEYLDQIGVEMLSRNPNVGEHLQDHLFVGYQYRTHRQTLNNELHSWRGMARHTLRYLLTRKGPLSNSVNQFGGFVRTAPNIAAPNLQLYFNPATYTTTRNNGGSFIKPDNFPAFTLGFQPTRPTSRGSVNAISPDVTIPPEIRMNSLSTNEDIDTVVAGGRYIAGFLHSETLRAVITGRLSSSPDTMSDAEIVEDFRARSTTTFHPCGTCRMGSDISNSVVDGNLKVHGLERLFVADASVFPSVTSGNTNAPTMMVARRATDLILKAE